MLSRHAHTVVAHTHSDRELRRATYMHSTHIPSSTRSSGLPYSTLASPNLRTLPHKALTTGAPSLLPTRQCGAPLPDKSLIPILKHLYIWEQLRHP